MRPNTCFVIEIDGCGVDPIHLHENASCEATAFAIAEAYLQPGNEIFIACLGGGVDFGNLILEVSAGGEVDIVAHEHSGFQVHGISLEQALAALRVWLPLQERDARLTWSEQ